MPILQSFVRGTTIPFGTTFYSSPNVPTLPSSATLRVYYIDTSNAVETDVIPMTAPTPPAVTWMAIWESRVARPGYVSYSLHNDDQSPYAVEDGAFMLTANSANVPF